MKQYEKPVMEVVRLKNKIKTDESDCPTEGICRVYGVCRVDAPVCKVDAPDECAPDWVSAHLA